DRGARPGRADEPLPGPQSRLRRDTGRPDRGDRHRGRRPPPALWGVPRVKAILLAAGYGTRLRPLTDDRPKHLLPVGGRPMLDWILDWVRELEDVDAVHLVTNSRFAPDFSRWAEPYGVTVHDDGTTSNEDRLGAVGDLRLVIESAGLQRSEEHTS